MMRFLRKNGVVPMFFVIAVALLGSSCSRDKDTGPRIPKNERRTVTIINNTGCDVKSFSVGVADGENILEENGYPLSKANDFVILDIQPAYRENGELTIWLVDRYDRIYEKTFQVALEGETETPITKTDRKSEGMVTDKWKDLSAFADGGCKDIAVTNNLLKRRTVKIINKSGCDVTYFSVSVADGEDILKKNGHTFNNEKKFVIRDIQRAYREKMVFTILLVDKFDRNYEKTFRVKLEGETETPVTTTDRKSEGFFTDKKKDLNAFMNGGCKE